jgi:hypothetical protein
VRIYTGKPSAVPGEALPNAESGLERTK